MRDEIRKCFFDIQQACSDIVEFIGEQQFEDYVRDLKTQRAVEREFEIIGEALNRIKREDPELLENVSEHHKIIGFRNILAHGYDMVDEIIVWKAITEHLPILMAEVKLVMGS